MKRNPKSKSREDKILTVVSHTLGDLDELESEVEQLREKINKLSIHLYETVQKLESR